MAQFRNQFTPKRVAFAGGLFLVALGYAIFMQVEYPPFGKTPPTATRDQWNDYWWLFALCLGLVIVINTLVLWGARRREARLQQVEPVTDAADQNLNPLRKTGMQAAFTRESLEREDGS